MAAPQNAPLVPFFGLADGMIVRVTALSPTTGAVVSGVVVSSVVLSIEPDEQATAPPAPADGPVMFLPG